MRISAILALLPVLSGCIAFPTFERTEFREETLAFIEPGVTTRAELETELVHDKMLVSERRSGRLLVYADFRSTAFIAAEHSNDTLGVQDYLVVEYDDEERVVWFEAHKGSGSCTSTDVCVRKGVNEHGPDQLALLVFAPTNEDQHAKTFGAPAGTCNVHAWTESNFLCPSRGGARITFVGEGPEQWTGFAPRGYLRWNVAVPDSGMTDATIEVTHSQFAWRDQPPSTHTVSCANGGNVFVELTPRCNLLGIRGDFEFRMVPESEGREAILDRQLILN